MRLGVAVGRVGQGRSIRWTRGPDVFPQCYVVTASLHLRVARNYNAE